MLMPFNFWALFVKTLFLFMVFYIRRFQCVYVHPLTLWIRLFFYLRILIRLFQTRHLWANKLYNGLIHFVG